MQKRGADDIPGSSPFFSEEYHPFSSQDGSTPHLDRASFLRIKKMRPDSGEPWMMKKSAAHLEPMKVFKISSGEKKCSAFSSRWQRMYSACSSARWYSRIMEPTAHKKVLADVSQHINQRS
jgi:hypothetical protein